MNLIMVFLTGLTVGGLTCLAVQGGLLASIITSRGKEGIAVPATISFLLAKLLSHTLLGFVLGAFGSGLNMGGSVQTYMQLAAGVYMLIIALNLLDVHPIFRYAVIQTPKFLARMVKKQSKSKDFFAPVLLGIMTIFIPCGTTMAMETLAISSASPVMGGMIMAAFVLGTAPLFLGMGLATSYFGEAFRSKFYKVAAILLIVLGITSIKGALVAFGVPIPAFGSKTQAVETSQNVTIEITSSGYSPKVIIVKKGLPVTLRIVNKESYSCASAFRVPTLGFGVNLQPGQEETLTFTPKESGKIPFACSMGMYRGVIEVI